MTLFVWVLPLSLALIAIVVNQPIVHLGCITGIAICHCLIALPIGLIFDKTEWTDQGLQVVRALKY